MKKKTKKNFDLKINSLNFNLVKSLTNNTKKKFENYISELKKKELNPKLIKKKD